MCKEVRELVTNDDVKQAMKDKKIPIKKALCDNSLSFAKFVRRKLRAARHLQCSAHLTGILFHSVECYRLPLTVLNFFEALHGRSERIENNSGKRIIIDVFIVK